MTILSSFLAHHHCTHQATHERAVNLVIADGHFILPQLFVWVCIGFHTHFIQYYKITICLQDETGLSQH